MKSRPSKLDRFAAQLAELDAEKKTLSDICEWLAAEGCKASPSSVSVYLERLRSERRQAALLTQIASGSRQSADVEKQFSKNPAPALDTIIKLHRVMIMQLATKSVDNPELIEVTNALTKTVMDFVSGQAKAEIEKQKLSQGERKIVLLEKKAAQADATATVLADAQLTPAQREQRIKEIYGRA
jgi:DNA-binding phage protein